MINAIVVLIMVVVVVVFINLSGDVGVSISVTINEAGVDIITSLDTPNEHIYYWNAIARLFSRSSSS